MAVTRASSSLASGNATLVPSCSSNYTRYGARDTCNKSFLLRIQPAGALRQHRRRSLGAVRAEQGDSNRNQGGKASSSGFSLPTLPEWAKWVFAGSVWLSSVPAWQKIRDVGRLVVRVDEVVEKVEDLAQKADHIAEELAEDLPDGELKKVVLKVEKMSEDVVAKAQMIDDILDKTDEVVRKLYNSTKSKEKDVAGRGGEKDVPASME